MTAPPPSNYAGASWKSPCASPIGSLLNPSEDVTKGSLRHAMIRDYLQFLGTLWTLWRGRHDNPIVRYTRVRGGWRRDWATILMAPLALLFFAAPLLVLTHLSVVAGGPRQLSGSFSRWNATVADAVTDAVEWWLPIIITATRIVAILLPILFILSTRTWRRSQMIQDLYFTALSPAEIAFGAMYHSMRGCLLCAVAVAFNSCCILLLLRYCDRGWWSNAPLLLLLAPMPIVLAACVLPHHDLALSPRPLIAVISTWLDVAAWCILPVLVAAASRGDLKDYVILIGSATIGRVVLLRENLRGIRSKVFAPVFPEEFARHSWMEQHLRSLWSCNFREWLSDLRRAVAMAWLPLFLGSAVVLLLPVVVLCSQLRVTRRVDWAFSHFIGETIAIVYNFPQLAFTLPLVGTGLGFLAIRVRRGMEGVPPFPKPVFVHIAVALVLLFVVWIIFGDLGSGFLICWALGAFWTNYWVTLAACGAIRSTRIVLVWHVLVPLLIVLPIASMPQLLGLNSRGIVLLVLLVQPTANLLLLPIWLDKRLRLDAARETASP